MATDVAAVLAAKETELRSQLDRLTEPVDEPGSISFGKRVGEGTSQAVERLSAVAAHDKLQQTLADVERAQHKLGEGSYGVCDVCAQDIDADRLEARPWANTCVRDAG